MLLYLTIVLLEYSLKWPYGSTINLVEYVYVLSNSVLFILPVLNREYENNNVNTVTERVQCTGNHNIHLI